MRATRRVDELGGDADAVAGLADAAFDDILDPQAPRDLRNVDALVTEGEGGVAGDHEEGAEARQLRDDVLGYAVAEIGLLLIATHIREGEDRDGWLVRRNLRRCHRGAAQPRDAVHAHRLADVFQDRSPAVLEAHIELVPYVVEGAARYEDATGIGATFQAGGDIDAIAIEVAALDHDVAEVDSYSQHDAARLRQIAVRGDHSTLQVDCALAGVDDAAELYEYTVAG